MCYLYFLQLSFLVYDNCPASYRTAPLAFVVSKVQALESTLSDVPDEIGISLSKNSYSALSPAKAKEPYIILTTALLCLILRHSFLLQASFDFRFPPTTCSVLFGQGEVRLKKGCYSRLCVAFRARQ